MEKELKALEEARAADQGGNNQPGNNQNNNQQPQANSAQKKKPAVNQLSVFGDSNDDLDLNELGGAGSGFYGHKGRDAENKVGGSLPRGAGGAASKIERKDVKKIAAEIREKVQSGKVTITVLR